MTRSAFSLLPAASGDLDAIFEYGLERFGWRQTESYARELGRTFQLLADNAGLGTVRDDIAPGLRGFVSGAHVIFYRAARANEHGDIVIVRILGKSMDHERHLK